MIRYRKKPEIFEAMQWDGSNFDELSKWCPVERSAKEGVIILDQHINVELSDYIVKQEDCYERFDCIAFYREFEEDYISRNYMYNFIIENYEKYKLKRLDSRYTTMILLNILEAHGECFDDIGDEMGFAFDNGVRSRNDAVGFYLETNAFFSSESIYLDSIVSNLEISFREAVSYMKEKIAEKSLFVTTDGLVEINIC